MALSDYEKQVLAGMEAQLREADPKLASVMTSSLPDDSLKAPGKLSPRRIALGSIVAILGLAIVVVGVSLGVGIWAIVLGVVGFVFMVGGVLWALKVDRDPTASVKEKSKSERSGDFMSRQRERWEKHNRS